MKTKTCKSNRNYAVIWWEKDRNEIIFILALCPIHLTNVGILPSVDFFEFQNRIANRFDEMNLLVVRRFVKVRQPIDDPK